MAENIFDKFTIQVKFDTKEFNDSAKKMNNTIEDFVKNSVRNLSLIGGAIGGGAIVATLSKIVTGFSDMGSRIGYMADTLVDGTKNLQLFEQAAKRTGGTVQGMDATLAGLSQHLTQISNGQDLRFQGVLQSLGGISAFNPDGNIKNPTDLLKEIGGALYKLPAKGLNGQRFYEQLLGIDPNQIRAFVDSKSNVQNRLNSIQSSGILGNTQIGMAERANKDFAELSQQFTNLKNLLATGLIPVVTTVVETLNTLGEGLNTLVGKSANLIDKVVTKVSNVAVKQGHGLLASLGGTLPGMMSANDIAQIRGIKSSNYWDSPAILKAQQMRENAKNNPYATMTDKNGNTSYGTYQITPATAESLTGRKWSPNELMDPKNNISLRNKNIDHFARLAQQMGLTDPKAITMAALAGHNGGRGGFDHYIKTGQSYNGYAESIVNNAGSKYANLNSNGGSGESNIILQGDVHVVANNPESFGTQLKANSRIYTAAANASNRKI